MTRNPAGYSVASYGQMINCEPRMSAYAEALRGSITPGCRVIDIGAGTGIFSLLACQYGAGSVIAVEPHDAIELLRIAAVTNGFSDRITIVQGMSTDYDGPRADVIISDLRGHLPLFEHHIPTIIDARERLLAPGGQLIAKRDRLFAALVHDPEFHRPCIEPWTRNAFGLDLSDGHRFAVNNWRKASFTPMDLMSAAQELLLIDYATVTDPNIAIEYTLAPEAPGEAHGFLVWFDAELAPGIGFSNAPGEPEQVYGQTFFPFEQPIDLAAGDRIDIALKANLIGDSYVWSWITNGNLADGTQVSFRQSTFAGKILTPTMLQQVSPDFAPPASAAQAIDRHCLSLIDGQATLGEIADQLTTEFPERFKDSADALAYAGELAGRYRAEKPASPENR